MNNNQFPPEHLFTRLLAEAAAAEAAAAEAEALRQQERLRQQHTEIALKRAEFVAYIGPDFMAAIAPYIQTIDYHRASDILTIRIEIPQHNDIVVLYAPSQNRATARTYGTAERAFSHADMLPFAGVLRAAQENYANDAAEIAHQRAVDAAVAEYEAERARIREANRAALERLQAEYDDGAFDLYTLEYGIITEDGEGGREAVMVLHEEPDDRDCWLVVNYSGKQAREKFFYPVSLSGPDQYRATGRYYTRPVTVDGYGVVGYLAPTASDERVAAYAQRAAAVLQPLPELPEILNGLDI